MEFILYAILVGIMICFIYQIFILNKRISNLENNLTNLKNGRGWGNINGEYNRYGKLDE